MGPILAIFRWEQFWAHSARVEAMKHAAAHVTWESKIEGEGWNEKGEKARDAELDVSRVRIP
jgi:hypothetical protein